MTYVPNGLGPSWFPDWLTQGLTRLGRTFFDEASWEHHDIGYARADPARWICDWKFFRAMIRDAIRLPWIQGAPATILAVFLWLCVRCFGWISYGRVDE